MWILAALVRIASTAQCMESQLTVGAWGAEQPEEGMFLQVLREGCSSLPCSMLPESSLQNPLLANPSLYLALRKADSRSQDGSRKGLRSSSLTAAGFL